MPTHTRDGCQAQAILALSSLRRQHRYSNAHKRYQHLRLLLLSRRCNLSPYTCLLHQPTSCHHRPKCHETSRYELCHMHATILPQAGFQHQLTGPFRPSAWELEPEFAQATSSMPFQTSIFRKYVNIVSMMPLNALLTPCSSHFNTAHFLNPDFQPEEWHPEDEYITTSSRSSKHRNSG